MNNEHNWRCSAHIQYRVVYYRRFAYLPVLTSGRFTWLKNYYYSEVNYFYNRVLFKTEHNNDIAPHLTVDEYLVHTLCGKIIEKN